MAGQRTDQQTQPDLQLRRGSVFIFTQEQMKFCGMRPRCQPSQTLMDDPHPTGVDSSYDSYASVQMGEMK